MRKLFRQAVGLKVPDLSLIAAAGAFAFRAATIGLAIVAAGALAACDSPWRQGGAGAVSLTIQAPAWPRTAGPVAGDLTPARYDVHGESAAAMTIDMIDQTDNPLMVGNLHEGEWSFTAMAKNASGAAIAQGSFGGVAVLGGQTTTGITIALTALTGGVGALDLNFSWPADSFTDVPTIVCELRDGAGALVRNLTSTATLTTWTLSAVDIDIGTYALVFIVTDQAASKPSTTYVDTVHVYQGLTTPVSVSFPPGALSGPPSPPLNLTVTPKPGYVSLTWTDTALTEEKYTVGRATGPAFADWGPVATLPPNSQAWDDKNLAPGVTYRYVVSAYNVWSMAGSTEVDGAAEPGNAGLTLTVQLPDRDEPAFFGGAAIIKQGTNLALRAAHAGATYYRWYVDGAMYLEGADADFALVGATLADGVHHVSCEVAAGGMLYSRSLGFTVLADSWRLATGYEYSFAYKAGPGEAVWAMGLNSDGQFGDGTTAGTTIPMRINFAGPLAAEAIVSIEAGQNHTLFLTSDGELFSCGDDSTGQLGNGDAEATATPELIMTGVVAASADNGISMALRRDGTVWTFGSSGNGALGLGAATLALEPTRVESLSDIIAIAVGSLHSLAVVSDGSVRAFGENYYGELGDGTFIDSGVPVQVDDITTAVDVAVGMNHSIVLLSDGTICGFGMNHLGQLGDGDTTHRGSPVVMVNSGAAVAIEAGGSHSLFLDSSGTVWVCGADNNGQQGNGVGSSSSIFVPAAVPGVAATAIAAGGQYSLTVGNTNLGYAWGYNGYGQLGDGTTATRHSPIPILYSANNTVLGADLAFSNVGATQYTASWGAATDPDQDPHTLEYRVVIADAMDEIDTAEEMIAPGTKILKDWTYDLTSITVNYPYLKPPAIAVLIQDINRFCAYYGPAYPGGYIVRAAGGGVGEQIGGSALNFGFSNPKAIAFDAAENLYVSDTGYSRVYKIGADGSIRPVVGKGGDVGTRYGFAGDAGLATLAQINEPFGITLDAGGNLYIADQANLRIRRVDAATGIIATIAGGGATEISDGLNAMAIKFKDMIYGPAGIAVASNNKIFMVDEWINSIYEMSLSDGMIYLRAGSPSGSTGSADGDGTAAAFMYPRCITLDNDENLLIADKSNHKIRKMTTAAPYTVTTIAGTGTTGYNGDGIMAATAQLASPHGLAVTPAGDILIADYNNNRVRKIAAGTGLISTVVGNGTASSTGDGGLAGAATVNRPEGVLVGSDGRIVILEQAGSRIRVIY